MNAFDIFNLPISVDIDLPQLRNKYIKKQQEAHPDRGGEIIDSEKINESYTILKNRESRVKLILEIFEIDTNDSSTLPQGFLFEMMEISEYLESENLEIGQVKIDELLNSSNEEFAIIAQKFQPTKENIKDLAVWYQKNKYYYRLDKNLRGIKEI